MTAGRGFIALAALIFGNWHPFGLLGAALLFGFSQSLGDQLQTSAGISAYVVTMLPYVAVLVALVGLVGRSVPPAAVGAAVQESSDHGCQAPPSADAWHQSGGSVPGIRREAAGCLASV